MGSSKGPQMKWELQKDRRDTLVFKKAAEMKWGLHKGLRDVTGPSKGSQRCNVVFKRGTGRRDANRKSFFKREPRKVASISASV